MPAALCRVVVSLVVLLAWGVPVAGASAHAAGRVAAGPATPAARYRTRQTPAGEVVERSADGGATWSVLLTPGAPRPVSAAARAQPLVAQAACRPARYARVEALRAVGRDTLYIATSGVAGDYLEQGCDAAAGGLYVAGPGGAATALGTAGLPYAQDPAARGPRSYAVDSVTVVPGVGQGSIYVHAASGTGPESPPAGLYRSDDGGRTWQPRNDGLRPSEIITATSGAAVPVYAGGTLAVSPADPRSLTFVNDTGTYTSADGGLHWRSPGAPSGAALPGRPRSANAPAPRKPRLAAMRVARVAGRSLAAAAALPAGWAWSRVVPSGTVQPPPRQDGSAVWDAADSQLLVYGGTTTTWSRPMSDTWSYTPASGTWAPLPAGPPARYGASAVWDPVDNVMLVFGGQTAEGGAAAFYGDVWAYAPATATWTRLWDSGAAGGPPARSHAAAVWDATGGRMLMFGGQVSAASPPGVTNDLWSFTLDSSTGSLTGAWTQLETASAQCTVTCPQARYAALAAWDAAGGSLRLFGGRNSKQSILSDTWSWTEAAGWTQEDRAAQPAGRAETGAAFDTLHGVVVAGPGLSLASGNVNDPWADLPAQGTWQQLPIGGATAPPVRRLTQWVWDAADGAFLLFGGRVSGVGAANDLWSLAPTAGPVATPAPSPAVPLTDGLDAGRAVANDGTVLVGPAQIVTTTQSGARYVRLDFRIGSFPFITDTVLLSRYDTVVDNYLAAGIQVLGLVTSEATHDITQADWTANNRERNPTGNGDNPYLRTTYVQNALVPLVAHFHDRIKVWELWNEPNSYASCTTTTPPACTGNSYIYPSNFAALLADAYAAVKDPAGLNLSDVTLVSGGLFGHSIGGVLTATNAGADYLRNTFTMGITTTATWAAFAATHGGRYPLDGIGQHIYVDQNLLTTAADVAAYYGWIHDQAAAFETPQPTYLTEGGWATDSVSETTQAQNLDHLFTTSRQMGYVSQATWFQLQDNAAAALYFGLVDAAGNPKVALSHYAAQAAVDAATPSPTATVSPTATATSSPTETPTPSAAPSATSTATPSPTAAVTPSATATSPPSETATPSLTGTPTSGPTATGTATAPTTDTPSATGTVSPMATDTATPTAPATATAPATGTPSATSTATASPTRTATATDTPTATPSPTGTPTATATGTATSTAMPVPPATATSPPPSPSATASPSSTALPPPTSAPTTTATPAATPSTTPPNTPTASPTPPSEDTTGQPPPPPPIVAPPPVVAPPGPAPTETSGPGLPAAVPPTAPPASPTAGPPPPLATATTEVAVTAPRATAGVPATPVPTTARPVPTATATPSAPPARTATATTEPAAGLRLALLTVDGRRPVAPRRSRVPAVRPGSVLVWQIGLSRRGGGRVTVSGTLDRGLQDVLEGSPMPAMDGWTIAWRAVTIPAAAPRLLRLTTRVRGDAACGHDVSLAVTAAGARAAATARVACLAAPSPSYALPRAGELLGAARLSPWAGGTATGVLPAPSWAGQPARQAVRVSLPAGAVTTTATLRLRSLRGLPPALLAPGHGQSLATLILGGAVDVAVLGAGGARLTLQAPAAVCLGYGAVTPPEPGTNSPRVARYDAASGEFVALPSAVDAAGKRSCAEVPRPGVVAVVARLSPATLARLAAAWAAGEAGRLAGGQGAARAVAVVERALAGRPIVGGATRAFGPLAAPHAGGAFVAGVVTDMSGISVGFDLRGGRGAYRREGVTNGAGVALVRFDMSPAQRCIQAVVTVRRPQGAGAGVTLPLPGGRGGCP